MGTGRNRVVSKRNRQVVSEGVGVGEYLVDI